MKKYVFLFVLSLFLPACSFQENTNLNEIPVDNYSTTFEFDKSFVPENFSLLAMGDSLTQGVGDELNEGGYTLKLATYLESLRGTRSVQLQNEGKRGRRSDQLLDYLETGVLDDAISYSSMMTITMGGNDVMKIVKGNFFTLNTNVFNQERPKFTLNLYQSIDYIRQFNSNAPIILIGIYNPFSVITDDVPQFNEIVDSWNASIEQIAKSDVNACYVPIDDIFQSNSKLLFHTDFFHPNHTGYERMSERIITSIEGCGLSKLTNGELTSKELKNDE